MQALGVLVVDNHPVVRYALSSLLDARAAWTAEAASGDEAWNAIVARCPSVVVLEMELEGRASGAELCQKVKAMDKAPHVLFFTSDSSPSAVVAAISAGADSFLHKSVGSSSSWTRWNGHHSASGCGCWERKKANRSMCAASRTTGCRPSPAGKRKY